LVEDWFMLRLIIGGVKIGKEKERKEEIDEI